MPSSFNVSGPAGEIDTLPTVPWERVERFVGQLTHDIRNGLNAVELQLTFLGEISTDPEAVDEIKRVRASLGNITRQLQSLRVATGTVKAHPLEYPAAEFFDDLRERLVKQQPAAKEGVDWETNLSSNFMLMVDPELSISALLELLANALTFRQVDAQVRVVVAIVGDAATFILQEPQPTQPDVAPQDWGRTPLLTTRRGAYGLGLFRARRSFESQGGKMDIIYSAEDQVLTTVVTLPGAPLKPS